MPASSIFFLANSPSVGATFKGKMWSWEWTNVTTTSSVFEVTVKAGAAANQFVDFSSDLDAAGSLRPRQ